MLWEYGVRYTLLFIALFVTPTAVYPFDDAAGVVDIFWEQYLGIGSPILAADSGKSPSCYAYFRLFNDAKPVTYANTNLSVTVHHFLLGHAQGVLVLRRTNVSSNDEVLGTAIYRLRVVGPDGVWLLEPTYCRQDIAMASYNLSKPGWYSVEVIMPYSSFVFGHPNASKAIAQPWVGYLTLEARPSAQPGSPGLEVVNQTWGSSPDVSILDEVSNADSNLTQPGEHFVGTRRMAMARDRPLCPDTGLIPGRWHFRKWPNPEAAPLLQTCMFFTPDAANCESPEHKPLNYDLHPATLFWRPYGCRMRAIRGVTPYPSPELQRAVAKQIAAGLHQEPQYQPPLPQPELETHPPPITIETCMPPHRHVCFVGDSHVRYMFNSFNMWYNNYHDIPDLPDHGVVTSDAATYFMTLWGYDLPQFDGVGTHTLAGNCTDVIVSFGQWALSMEAGAEPFRAADYVRMLLNVRHNLLQLRELHGVRVFWGLMPMPSIRYYYDAAGKEWRSDPMILLFNRLAYDVMNGVLFGRGRALTGDQAAIPNGTGGALSADAATIPIIDYWSASRTLSDTTWDGIHFVNTGAVGIVQLGALLHALCSEGVLEELTGR